MKIMNTSVCLSSEETIAIIGPERESCLKRESMVQVRASVL